MLYLAVNDVFKLHIRKLEHETLGKWRWHMLSAEFNDKNDYSDFHPNNGKYNPISKQVNLRYVYQANDDREYDYEKMRKKYLEHQIQNQLIYY